MREWIAAVGAKTAFIEPGSPWENCYCESFNSKLRDELLNGEIFYTGIHPMTGLVGLRLRQWAALASPDHRADHRRLVPTGAGFRKVGDAGAFCADSVEAAFIETHLSRGFRWYA